LAVLATILVLTFVAVGVAGQLQGSPTELVADPLRPPSWDHPFGTDALGRDLLARTGHGAWTSLLIALGAVGCSIAFALPLGLVAAWHPGGRLDGLIMRLVETTQVVPPFILVLLLLGLTGSGAGGGPGTPAQRIAGGLAIGFVPFFARVVRSAALAERHEAYLHELRRIGASRLELAVGELLPNIAPAIATQALLALAIVVFAEGGLSFLGLGVPPPDPTLGNLIAEAGGQLLGTAWWYALLPGLVLIIAITGLNLAADVASGATRRPSGAAADETDALPSPRTEP
jgi:peptide/nickel transport system permease protein